MRRNFPMLAVLALSSLAACEAPKMPPSRVDVHYVSDGYNAVGTAYPISEAQRRCALLQMKKNDPELSTLTRINARSEFVGLHCVEREIDP